MMLLISALGVLGAGAAGWWRRRSQRLESTRTAPPPGICAVEGLPDDESERLRDGLAAFYAYQMAASRIDRASSRGDRAVH
jgi:hypothetical protein